MIEIIDYEESENTVSAGFKRNNYVVYGTTAKSNEASKEEWLQTIFEQVIHSLNYEEKIKKSGGKNTITSNKSGVKFEPNSPIPTSLVVDFNKLKGRVIDQYGEIYSDDVKFAIKGTDYATIEKGKLKESEVEEDVEYKIVASYQGLSKSADKVIYSNKPSELELIYNDLNQKISTTASKNEFQTLKEQLLDAQTAIIEMQYKGLIGEGGL